MSRSKASGISLTNHDASIVLGMAARGDRDHDIAAWFGVNQGRIAEVKAGSHGSISAAMAKDLPPKGPPGLKGRRLRASVRKAITAIEEDNIKSAIEILQQASTRYDDHDM
jgi:hypothetical protein